MSVRSWSKYKPYQPLPYWDKPEEFIGPYPKPSINHVVIRSGYRGDIRVIVLYVKAFGYVISCTDMEQAKDTLQELYTRWHSEWI